MAAWSFKPNSLRGKILLYTGVAIMVLLVAVIIMFSQGMYRQTLTANQENIRVHVAKAALEIERNNTIAVTLARTMAMAQENGMFGKRAETMKLIYKVVENYPRLFDAYVIYEPNADGQDHLFRNLPGGEKSGRFNAVVDNLDGKLVPVLAIDMETSLYYQGVKERLLSGAKEKYMITEPYLYERTLMVETTYPIVIDGKFAGIAGVDRTLTFLTAYLTALKPYRSADFILLSRLGGVICATMDPSLNTKKMANTPYHAVLNHFFRARSADEIVKAEDTRDGQDYFYTATTIETGGWTLVLRVSESEILHPIYEVLSRVILLSVVGFLITLLVLIWISRSITRPIGVAVSAAERVASGDLNFQVQSSATDETGQLLAAIQTMTRSLNALIGQVQRSGIQVTTSTTQIAASAKQLEATVAEQAASTNHVSTMSDTICRQSLELGQTMNELAEVGARTASLADSGRSGLVGMETNMQDVVKATATISDKLGVITEKAGNINQVITTITKVADQTNLLSLNAAIEAEKAGEMGRGFAVVAREIRRLADQTAVATLEIEGMVKEMQGAVAAGVAGMDSFSAEVRKCVKDIAIITDRLEEIINEVQALNPRFADANAGMQSQSEAARQISEIMAQLSQAAQQTSASVREFNQATWQLQEAARGMRDEVSRFKVGA